MALGESRQVLATTIDFVVNAAAERGGIMCAQSGSIASYNTAIGGGVGITGIPSGIVPVGVLLQDIESMQYSKHPQYLQRDVSDIGSKVSLMTVGECYTDFLDPYAVPHIQAGKVAYLTNSGMVTTRDFAPGEVGASSALGGGSGIVVGRFMSNADSNGYAKLWVNIVR